ncbi:MAG: hypothetical protein AABW63_03540 [Nanoarchaeota archaeon]
MKKALPIIFVFFLVFAGIGLVSSAEYQGTLKFDNDGGKIVVGGGSCEDWSSSFWSECAGNQQTFVCIQSNPSCPTKDLKPAQCDQTRACGTTDTPSVSSGGGGGGGGGGSSINSPQVFSNSNNDQNQTVCTENWVCSVWSNAKDQCGTRDCVDWNGCGTEELKPLTEKECESSVTQSDGITFYFSAIGDFVKTKTGGIIVFVVLVVGIGILAWGIGKRKKKTEIAEFK